MSSDSAPAKPPEKAKDRAPWYWPLLLWLVPRVYELYMRLVWWTSRVRWIGFEPFRGRQRAGQNLVASLWHQDCVLGPWAWRDCDGVMMVSHSRDGELIAISLRRLGYHVVRGSSSRGGKEALRELMDYQQTVSGKLFGLTVDGPKGPRYKSKLGPIVLAARSGDPLFPVFGWASRNRVFNSWDRTMVPLPFSRIFILCGEALHVPREASDAELEEARAELDRRMMRLVELSQELCAHPERADEVERTWPESAGARSG